LVAGAPGAREAAFASDKLGLDKSEGFGGVGTDCPAFRVGFFCETDEGGIIEPGLESSDLLVFVGCVD
jgi:hypothetical protein